MGNKQSKYIHFVNENMYSIEMIEDNSNIIPFIERMFIHPSNNGIEIYHENNHILTINWIKVNQWSHLQNIFKISFNISNKSYYLCFFCTRSYELAKKMLTIARNIDQQNTPE